MASLRQSPNADGSLVAQLQEQLEAVKGLLNEATTRNDALESETNQLQNEREELKLSLENEKKSFQEQLSASRKEYEKLQAVNEEVNVALTALRRDVVNWQSNWKREHQMKGRNCTAS